jgi:hypothetical protein
LDNKNFFTTTTRMSLLDTPPTYVRDPSVRRSKSDRSRSSKPKPKKYVADTIDQLDTTSFGGPYHHGGPYDATLRSFNVNKHYSPVAAVKEGNRAAWEATPREAQLDSLIKGRPLDNVASVPPGERTMNGQIMNYEYGTDMFRDPDAGGGAYNRWPGLVSLTPSRLKSMCLCADLNSSAIPPGRPERKGRARLHHR